MPRTTSIRLMVGASWFMAVPGTPAGLHNHFILGAYGNQFLNDMIGFLKSLLTVSALCSCGVDSEARI
jgi:hypothetical protein